MKGVGFEPLGKAGEKSYFKFLDQYYSWAFPAFLISSWKAGKIQNFQLENAGKCGNF